MHKLRIRLTHTLLAGFLTFLPLATTLAQEPEPAAAAEVAEPEELTLWQLIKQGGITMFPLGLFSMAVVALVIRNFVVLKEEKLLPSAHIPALHHHLAKREIKMASHLCRQEPSLLTEVLDAGLQRAQGDQIDLDNIKEAIEEAGTEQLLHHMKPISYLSTIGAVSPMLGLLGTVSGMIKAFQHISAGGMGKPEVLAADIGEALVTTATGLIIAIPAMLFYFYFKGNFMKTMASLGRVTGSMLDSLRSGQVPDQHLPTEDGGFSEEPNPA